MSFEKKPTQKNTLPNPTFAILTVDGRLGRSESIRNHRVKNSSVSVMNCYASSRALRGQ